ncbi:MAG: tRNA (N6-threonylcarbamoyladenosine(37)-N6)-methyltransferase TrmO [Candidatus Helarchaeota archaeon]
MKLEPIGVIHSPFKFINVPYQGKVSEEICEIEIIEKYAPGLKDIESFSHLIVIFYLHKHRGALPLVHPTRWGPEPRGVFATRSPFHPNSIGITVTKLIERKNNVLKVYGLDAIDGTPLIDIKPYVPEFDCFKNASSGWFKEKF